MQLSKKTDCTNFRTNASGLHVSALAATIPLKPTTNKLANGLIRASTHSPHEATVLNGLATSIWISSIPGYSSLIFSNF